jgi:glycosyltransferase involved in cell wall biosynthesis
MQVLIVSVKRDYANMSYTLEQCLKEVGVDAMAIVKGSWRPHHAKKVDPARFYKFAKKAKIVQFMHSVHKNLKLTKKQRVFVYHGGSRYRENYEKMNKIFNPIVEKSIIQTGDMLGLGAKNEVWLLPAVDTKSIKPVYKRRSDKIIVGHYPSGPLAKNTKGINEVIGRLKADFGHKFTYAHSTDRVNWNKNIKRVARCDIYIEACNPMLKGKHSTRKYGEWGVAGVEAAALGKVVVTHFLSQERYAKEYGKCGLVVANSLDEVESQMRKLLSLSDEKLLAMQEASRAWVEKFHSHHAVGKRLKEVVYKI